MDALDETLRTELNQVNSALVVGLAQRAIRVTSSGAVPVFRTWTVSAAEPPTVMVPNDSEAGSRAMFGAGAATPAPVSATDTLGLVASLLVTAIEPVSVVVSVGA